MADAHFGRRSAKSCVFCEIGEPEDGRFLHCLHVICVSCLLENLTPEGCIECSVCTELTEQRLPAVELRKQLVPSQLLSQAELPGGDESGAAGSSSTVPPFDRCSSGAGVEGCDFCEGGGMRQNPATHACLDCSGARLCMEHAAEHGKIRVFRDHDVKPLSALARTTSQDDGGGTAATLVRAVRRCPLHGKQELSHACSTCHVPVCKQCLVKGHQQHCVVSLSEMADNQRLALQSDVPAGRRDPGPAGNGSAQQQADMSASSHSVKARVDTLKANTSDEILKVNNEAMEASQHVTDTFGKLKKLISKIEAGVLDDVDAARWRQQRPLEEKSRHLMQIEEKQSMAVELGQYLCGPQCSDADVMRLGPIVQRKLDACKSDIEKETELRGAVRRPTVRAVILMDVMAAVEARMDCFMVVFEDPGVDMDQITVSIPDMITLGYSHDVMLTVPCKTNAVLAGAYQRCMQVALVSTAGARTAADLSTIGTPASHSSSIILCARVKAEEIGEHTLEVRLGDRSRSFPVLVQAALRFDLSHCTADMHVSGCNNSIVSRDETSADGKGLVYGTVGYTAGVHTWSLKVSGEQLIDGGMCTGVALVPGGRLIDPGTGWHCSGSSFCQRGGRRRDTGTQPWQDGDILTFTLDYDAGSLELHVQRTDERRTISGMTMSGSTFYIFVSMWSVFRQVEII
eukprot:scpid46827/ scgid15494/ 